MGEKDHPNEEESEEKEVREPEQAGAQNEGESRKDVGQEPRDIEQAEGEAASPEAPEEDEKDRKISELHSKLQYLQAEYENLKKRAAKDLETVVRFGNEDLVRKLLPVLDDFEASLDSITDDEVKKGFGLLLANLVKTLKDEGLEEITAMGETFDPFRHEAVLETDAPDREENEVAEVMRKGYLFRSKVIRASKVKVVKHHQEEDKEVGENG